MRHEARRIAVLVASLAVFACKAKLGDCEREPLERLADQLAAAEPHAQPDLVHAQLPEACRLPSSMAEYLEHLRPVGSEVPHHDARSSVLFMDRDAFGHACAAGLKVFDVLPDLSGPERSTYLYETCELGRYELASVEDGVPIMPYALHRWLLDQGLDAERARTISRAVMLSDIRAYAPAGTYADRQLPEVPDSTPTLDLALAVVPVTTSAILMDNRKPARIREGSIAPGQSSDSDVPQLLAWFSSARSRTESWSESNSPPPMRIDIAADVGTQLETIVKICNTALAAEIHECGLVVETGPWDQGALSFELARPGETYDVRVDLDEPEPAERVCADGEAQLTIEIGGHEDDTVAEFAALLAAVRARPCVARVLLRVA
jgi:hypothetical protein